MRSVLYVFLRFRLRYSTASDCYYLHWDQTVCPPLARITGLATGATNVTGLTRYTDQESKMVRPYHTVVMCLATALLNLEFFLNLGYLCLCGHTNTQYMVHKSVSAWMHAWSDLYPPPPPPLPLKNTHHACVCMY